jgi:type II secretory pathway component GspD/PulD (secretin)
MMKNKLMHCLTLSFVAVVSGCASFPENYERPDLDSSTQEVISGWNGTQAITLRPNRYSIDISTPDAVPDSIRATPIDIKTPGVITPKDLVFIFDAVGVQTVIASDDFESNSFYLPSYKGDIGGLIDLISEVSNSSFRWAGGAMIMDQTRTYMVRIAQQKDLTEVISSSITTLGAENVFASKESGSITYSSSTRNQKHISNYLDRLSVNTALIQLQLAVINVRLNDERNTGFDWSSFSLKVGDAGLLEEGFGAIGNLTSLGGGGAGIKLNKSNLSLAAALNLLSTYGESRTAQNLTLQTLSGVPVSLESGDEIPYVSDVPVSVNENSTTSGIETEIIKTGFKVEVEALYDNDESLVTVSMDLNLTSLIGFRELSAGNQLGSITQPEVQKQTLKSIIKLGAGETALLGGLIIETFSDNRRNLAMLESLPTGSQSIDNTQTAVFIMLRPTVTVFGNK